MCVWMERDKEKGKERKKERNQSTSWSWANTVPQSPSLEIVPFLSGYPSLDGALPWKHYLQNHQRFSLCLLRFTSSMHILTTSVFSLPFWVELIKVCKLFLWGFPQQSFQSSFASYVSRWVWGLPLLPLLASSWEMQSHLNVSWSQLN